MSPYIEQNDLFVGDHHGKRDPVTISKADRLDVLQFAAEAVQFKVRLEGVFFHVINEPAKPLF